MAKNMPTWRKAPKNATEMEKARHLLRAYRPLAHELKAVLPLGYYPISADAARAAWEDGNDWVIVDYPPGWIGGPYFSCRDAAELSSIGINTIVTSTFDGELVKL